MAIPEKYFVFKLPQGIHGVRAIFADGRADQMTTLFYIDAAKAAKLADELMSKPGHTTPDEWVSVTRGNLPFFNSFKHEDCLDHPASIKRMTELSLSVVCDDVF